MTARNPKLRVVAPAIPADESEWDRIEADFALGHDHRLLVSAGRQAWHRWRSIVDKIDGDGLLIAGRYRGTDRSHPLLPHEVTARAAVVAILKALNLPEAPEGRP